MNTNKVSLQIIDPAEIANQNIKENVDFYLNSLRHNSVSNIKDDWPDFHKLSNDNNNIGAYLLYIFNNPGKGDWKIVYSVQSNNFHGGMYNLIFCKYAKLVEEKPVKGYRDSLWRWVTKAFFITELGEAVLKQNGLI